jgi:hypothetical protein
MRRGNSRGAKSLRVLTAQLKNLQERVARLEHGAGPFIFSSAPEVIRGRLHGRRGPKPRWSPTDLLIERDKLHGWCSCIWPELSWIIRKARSQKQLERDLNRYNQAIWKSEHAQHLTAHVGALWEFTQSKRYTGEPRLIADALAGVPKLAWRTSFNHCGTHPTIALYTRACRDRLKRKFPERLRELLKAKSTEEIVEILSRARTQDPVIQLMRSMPERVMDMLRDGEARLLDEAEEGSDGNPPGSKT